MTQIQTELAEVRKAWAERVLAQDVDGLLALYLPNATLKPTLSPVFRTDNAGIRDYFEGTPDHPGFALKGWEKAEFSDPASTHISGQRHDAGCGDLVVRPLAVRQNRQKIH